MGPDCRTVQHLPVNIEVEISENNLYSMQWLKCCTPFRAVIKMFISLHLNCSSTTSQCFSIHLFLHVSLNNRHHASIFLSIRYLLKVSPYFAFAVSKHSMMLCVRSETVLLILYLRKTNFLAFTWSNDETTFCLLARSIISKIQEFFFNEAF